MTMTAWRRIETETPSPSGQEKGLPESAICRAASLELRSTDGLASPFSDKVEIVIAGLGVWPGDPEWLASHPNRHGRDKPGHDDGERLAIDRQQRERPGVAIAGRRIQRLI